MKKGRLAAAFAAIGIAASISSLIPMSAAADSYTPIHGDTFTFDKYLVMENEAVVPNVSFTFKVEPASGTDLTTAEGSVFTLNPGPAGIKFTADAANSVELIGESPTTQAKVSFKSADNDDTITEINKGTRTISFMTDTINDDEKFAEKLLTLDLSDVTFSQPGVYRYVITETDVSSAAGVVPDDAPKRYLDYYVSANAAGELGITGYIFYADDHAHKSTGFTNQYKTDNLFIEKAVTGNQGAKNRYFKINVKLNAPTGKMISDDNIFSIIGDYDTEKADGTVASYTADVINAANNVTQLTYAQLSAGHDFYICSGQNFEIKGLPNGIGYIVTEYQENYTPSVTFTGDNKTGESDTDEGTAIAGVETADPKTFSVTDTYLNGDTNIKFTNELTGAIPTGILMSVAGAAGLLAVGAAGVMCGYFFIRKKKSEEE